MNFFSLKYLLAILYIFAFTGISFGNEINCDTLDTNIECNYLIEVNSENISDLGTYNISILFNKIKEIKGVFNGKMHINAGLCGSNLKNIITENVQIAQTHNNHGYNFPVTLHKQKIEANFCISVLMNNCIDSCSELINLKVNISPIMKMKGR